MEDWGPGLVRLRVMSSGPGRRVHRLMNGALVSSFRSERGGQFTVEEDLGCLSDFVVTSAGITTSDPAVSAFARAST